MSIELQNLNIPQDFICPISSDLMVDPIITNCRHNFERLHFLRWITESVTREVTCPLCRTKITSYGTDENLQERIQDEFLKVNRANILYFQNLRSQIYPDLHVDAEIEINEILQEEAGQNWNGIINGMTSCVSSIAASVHNSLIRLRTFAARSIINLLSHPQRAATEIRSNDEIRYQRILYMLDNNMVENAIAEKNLIENTNYKLVTSRLIFEYSISRNIIATAERMLEEFTNENEKLFKTRLVAKKYLENFQFKQTFKFLHKLPRGSRVEFILLFPSFYLEYLFSKIFR